MICNVFGGTLNLALSIRCIVLYTADGDTVRVYTMEGECDLCIVHNADANAWKDYIVRLVTRFVARKGFKPLRIYSVDDASLTKTASSLRQSAIVIVILSPAHLDFLRVHDGVNYRALVDTHSTNALVLRCGIACFADIADQNSDVFTQFFGWNKLEDIDNGEPITKAVDILLSKLSARGMSPDKVASPTGPSSSTLRPNASASDLQSYYGSSSRSSGDGVFPIRRGSASSVPRVNSGTSEPLYSNRSSSDSWTATQTGDSVYDDASTLPHFSVIPTTIRCEARSLHVLFVTTQTSYPCQVVLSAKIVIINAFTPIT